MVAYDRHHVRHASGDDVGSVGGAVTTATPAAFEDNLHRMSGQGVLNLRNVTVLLR